MSVFRRNRSDPPKCLVWPPFGGGSERGFRYRNPESRNRLAIGNQCIGWCGAPSARAVDTSSVCLVWPKPNKSSRRPSLGSRRASARSGIGVSVRSRVVRWLVWVPRMRLDRPGTPCCPDRRFIVVTAREPRRAYIPAREPQRAIRQGTHDEIPCTLRWVRKRRS